MKKKVRASIEGSSRDDGFSLVELIVTVLIIGIIVVIAIPVFLNAQDSARQAAVESAARDGQVMARASIIDGSSLHGGDLSVLETDDVVLNLANTFVIGDESTVCVRADWIGTGEATNYAVSGPCAESDTTVPIVDREEDDPLYTQLTYQCPDTRTGYLGIININEDTRAQIWERDNREETIREVFYEAPIEDFDLRSKSRREILRTNMAETDGIEAANAYIDDAITRANEPGGVGERYAPEYSMENTIKRVSELVEMEGGVTYRVRFDGEVETFAAPGHRGNDAGNVEDSLADCLVSIDHFGDDINLKNIVYLGGANLEEVPETIPSSVQALRGAFENATYFNDPNIRTWDVSNVHTMRSMFHNTHRFNQDLSGWETESLIQANSMFSRAYAFNQDISSWDMSNVENMEDMFREATVFNQPLDDWDMSGTTNTVNMFYRAENFNQSLDSWVTTNVTNMYRMFDGATGFNQNISHWDVSNVEYFGRFSIDSGLSQSQIPERFRD